jgi:hypothetical protein
MWEHTYRTFGYEGTSYCYSREERELNTVGGRAHALTLAVSEVRKSTESSFFLRPAMKVLLPSSLSTGVSPSRHQKKLASLIITEVTI